MEENIKNQNAFDPDIYPPEPIKPFDSECCGTGCTPCVFDIYDKQLHQWKLQCEKIRKGDYYEPSPSSNAFITPDQYSTLKIMAIFKENESMKIFRFAWPGNSTEFPVKLGQHLLIKDEHEGVTVARQYSILRTDPNLRHFDILIKIYSLPEPSLDNKDRKMLTPILNRLQSDDEISVRGPFGLVLDYRSNTFSHLLFIVAGTGIAPMYRIIESVLNNEDDETRIKVLFSCPAVKDIPMISHFKKWSSFWNFEVTYFVPSYDKEVDSLAYYGMKIVNHRLNVDNFTEQLKISRCKPDSSMFYICGTKSFEKDVINHLSKIGVDSSKMKLF